MIRFQRIGRTNDPAFRIVVLEKERAAKSGRLTDMLGTYNPRSKAMTLNESKIKEWISKGAQPTPSIHNLLVTKGIIEGKKINVLPKMKNRKVETPAEPEASPAPAVSEAEAAPQSEAEPEVKTEEAPAT